MFIGLRIGEVLALRRGDIDLRHNRIKISKTLTTLADGTITMSDSPKTEAGNRKFSAFFLTLHLVHSVFWVKII